MGYTPPSGAGATPAQIWAYADRTLTLVEVFDGVLAAGAYITPTVSGLFSVAFAEVYCQTEMYNDAAGAWVPVGAVMIGCFLVAGEGNKIRFRNIKAYSQNVVVVRYG